MDMALFSTIFCTKENFPTWYISGPEGGGVKPAQSAQNMTQHETIEPITEAASCKASISAAQYWDCVFESHSRHGCLSAVILCWVVLCRQRSYDGQTPSPRNPTKCQNKNYDEKAGRNNLQNVQDS
jgi:hypothetical protein